MHLHLTDTMSSSETLEHPIRARIEAWFFRAAPEGSWIARVQRYVKRPWRWFFEGCDTHRDVAGLLREAGFTAVEITPFTLRTAFVPIRPQIAAVAIR